MAKPIKVISLLIIIIVVVLTCTFANFEFQAAQNIRAAKTNAEHASVDAIKYDIDTYHVMYGGYPDDMNDLIAKFEKMGMVSIMAQSAGVLNTYKKYNGNKSVPTVDIKQRKAQDKNIAKSLKTTIKYLSEIDLKYRVRVDGRAYRITYKSVDGDTKTVDGNYESDYIEKWYVLVILRNM